MGSTEAGRSEGQWHQSASRLGADHRRLHADPRRGRATANHDGIAPNPIGSDGQRHRRPSGRCCRGEVRRMVRAADRMDDRNAPQLPRRHPRILPVAIQNQAGARPSGRRAAQGTRATWATRAPRPGPTAYEAICLTSGMSSASTGIICSVRSVCALHTTHCRPNVTFRIGLSGNNLWKQSKQIF
jgi:hypothetical protein